MDFLLDNPLTMMDGYAFLALYVSLIVLAAVTIGLARANADKSDRLNIPAIPPDPDPYEIAFLRGSSNEAARSIIFALMQKGLVEIVTEGKVSHVKPVSLAVRVQGLANIEQATINWIGMSRNVEEMFDKKHGLAQELEPFFSIYRDRLESRQLLTSYESSARVRKYGIALIGTVVAIGVYRIFTSIMHGHFNVGFTIVSAFIGLLIIGGIGTLPRMTKLGKTYMERLRLAFDDLKYKSQAPYIRTAEPKVIQQAGFAGVDPLLLSVGVFGSTVLIGTVFDDYNAAFKKAEQQAASGGCGSGCGSGCSSGSDGGGSSCGGGCGGGGCGGGCGG